MNISKTIAAMAVAGIVASPAILANAHKVVHHSANTSEAWVTQNGPKSSAKGADWMRRITLSGLVNVDAVYAEHGQPADLPFFDDTASSTTNVAVSNVSLFADAKINDWANIHVNVTDSNNAGLSVEEAYVRVSNFAKSNFYGQFGNEYLPFGTYGSPYALTKSFTQLLSQANQSTVQFGYMSEHGWQAAAFFFNGDNSQSTGGTSLGRNYGTRLGYTGTASKVNYHVSASYLKDMRDLSIFSPAKYAALDIGTLIDQPMHAYALHGDFHHDAYSANVDYVASTSTMLAGGSEKPWALAVKGAYAFKTMDHDSKIALGYESTGETKTLRDVVTAGSSEGNAFARSRVSADYTVGIMKNMDLTFEYVVNKDFETDTDQSSSAFKMRLAVQF